MLLCLPNVEPGPFPIGDIVLQNMFGDTFLPAGEGQLLPKRVAPARAPPAERAVSWRLFIMRGFNVKGNYIYWKSRKWLSK